MDLNKIRSAQILAAEEEVVANLQRKLNPDQKQGSLWEVYINGLIRQFKEEVTDEWTVIELLEWMKLNPPPTK